MFIACIHSMLFDNLYRKLMTPIYRYTVPHKVLMVYPDANIRFVKVERGFPAVQVNHQSRQGMEKLHVIFFRPACID